MRRDFELFNFPSKVYRWKIFPQATLFFFLLDLMTFDLGLNLKQSKQGNEKKKKKKKKEMMK